MKLKISVVILFVFTFYLGVNAQFKVLENFNYLAGDTIGSYGWVSFSGGPNNPITVVTPGLTFSGYPQSGIGNSARMSNYGQDYYKQFTGDSITSGSIYVAFMVKVDSVKTGDYFIALLPPNNTTNYTSRFYIKDTSGVGFLFGISKGAASGGPIVYGTTIYQLNTTYMVVFKYKFNTGSTTDDEMSFYVFSSSLPNTEPPTPTVGPVTGTVTDATSLGRVALRQGSSSSSPTVVIDGIAVTTSWAAISTSVKNVSNVADKFSLSQNYPNPFNPSTNIQFSIPNAQFVTLKVFDILGKEVATMINEKLYAGTYEKSFNASMLNSGVYFYRLQTENYSDTKRMTLIK